VLGAEPLRRAVDVALRDAFADVMPGLVDPLEGARALVAG
jgi:hypothetical protein